MAKNEHLIVIPLEPLKKSKPFIDWPLHVTIVPWFAVPEERAEDLGILLTNIATRYRKFNVKVGGVAMFANGQLSVKLIEPAETLQALHLDVFNTLENNGFTIHQKDFLNANYRPHFIYQPEDKFKTGSLITISSFSLIRQVRQKVTGTMVKELVKEFELTP